MPGKQRGSSSRGQVDIEGTGIPLREGTGKTQESYSRNATVLTPTGSQRL